MSSALPLRLAALQMPPMAASIAALLTCPGAHREEEIRWAQWEPLLPFSPARSRVSDM